ncbi:MAG: MATE family efflux transporter [Eubacteriales bacterium]
MREKIFEEYSIPKAIFTLAAPTILGMLVTVVYNMADTYFVGKTNDPNMVAAVALILPIYYVIMALGNIFGVGGGTLISRLLGLKEDEKVKNVSAFCFYGSLVTGIAFAIILLTVKPLVLQILGTSQNTYDFADGYLTAFTLGVPAVMLQFTLGQIIRAEGAARQSMIGMIIGTVLNIILDPIMILNLGWGVAGAAVATVIGNISSVIYYIWFLYGKNTVLSIERKFFKASREIVSYVFKIGFSASLNTFLICVSNVILNNYAASYSDNIVAAVGISSRIAQVPKLLIIGLGQGIQPFVGYNYAAKNYSRMNGILKFSSVIGIVFGIVCYAFIFLTSGTLIRAFLDSKEVIDLGSAFLRAYISSLPVLVFLFIFMFSIQAFGKAIAATILSVCRDALAFIPLIIVLNTVFGYDGLAWAQPIADIVSCILAAILFFKIRQKDKNEMQLIKEVGLGE